MKSSVGQKLNINPTFLILFRMLVNSEIKLHYLGLLIAKFGCGKLFKNDSEGSRPHFLECAGIYLTHHQDLSY